MITIGRATAADAADIGRCLRAAFADYKDRYTAAAFADTVLSEHGARERIENMIVLVARNEAGMIVGTIGGSVDGAEGHLRGMAVLPDWQGRGAARQLLAGIEGVLAAAGCSEVSLDTTAPLMRAIAFYERSGYRASGVVRDFFGMPLYEYRKRLT